MSEESLRYLNDQVSRLEREKADLQVAVREERGKRKKVMAERDSFKAELDDFLSKADAEFGERDEKLAALQAEVEEHRSRAETAPDEKDARIKELETSIRTRDHKEAFGKALGADNALAEGFDVDDLWRYAGFDPSSADSIDDKQITELVGKARTAKPGLFKPAGDSGKESPSQGATVIKPPVRVANDGTAGRGARDTPAGRVTYSKADLATPGWQKANPSLVAAFKDGSAVCTDAN